jgi:bifunctional DNA-binding transcriptional regulator/antitoxin component of YhaV-PrlF toxin-antitoxin module
MSQTAVSIRLKLSDKGKLSLPVSILERAGLEVGESLLISVLEGGVIQLRSVRSELSSLQGKYATRGKS